MNGMNEKNNRNENNCHVLKVHFQENYTQTMLAKKFDIPLTAVKQCFKSIYGDMDTFVKQLKAEGISEIHYIGNLEKKLDAIPGYVTTPWMISGMGIIYGKK